MIIPAGYDSALYSNLPTSNINGRNEVPPNRGYGTAVRRGGEYVTYPIMHLNSGDELTVKDSFLLGGFELSSIKGEIREAKLKFFLNYCSHSRLGVSVAIRPLKQSWDESTISYLDIYESTEPGAAYTELVESDDNRSIFAYFDIKANPEEHKLSYDTIPLYPFNRTISIDITPIVKQWQDKPGENYGLLIDPLWKSDLRYRTSNLSSEMTYSGIIEVAPVEWLTWEGHVPEQFTERGEPWKRLTNRASGKMRYVPRLEVEVKVK